MEPVMSLIRPLDPAFPIERQRLSKICSHENQSFIKVGARLQAILADRLQQSGSYNQSFSF
jgi:hypothetical protein